MEQQPTSPYQTKKEEETRQETVVYFRNNSQDEIDKQVRKRRGGDRKR